MSRPWSSGDTMENVLALILGAVSALLIIAILRIGWNWCVAPTGFNEINTGQAIAFYGMLMLVSGPRNLAAPGLTPLQLGAREACHRAVAFALVLAGGLAS